jgi:predicted DNA-binding transcriptional regulator YafY
MLKELDRGAVNIKEISQELDISTRSIQRDILDITIVGFPIIKLSPGEYAFLEGFSLKSLKATDMEAAILISMFEIARKLGGDFEKTFKTLKDKIIPNADESPFYIKLPTSESYKRPTQIKALENAVLSKNIVDIEYKTMDGLRNYTLEPYKIVHVEGAWYLFAIRDSKTRTFKLENIKACKIVDKKFKHRADIVKEISKGINFWFDISAKKKAVLSIDKEVAHHFRKRDFFRGQNILKKFKNKDLIIEIEFSNYFEVCPVILSWMPFINIISPDDLKQELLRRAKAFISKNQVK